MVLVHGTPDDIPRFRQALPLVDQDRGTPLDEAAALSLDNG